MAFLIGYASPEEIQTLEDRGWEIEDPPAELNMAPELPDRAIMIWVDASIFGIMSGPDWDDGTGQPLNHNT